MGGIRELTVPMPGDKSVSQRALLLGAVAAGESRLAGMLRSADPLATGRAVQALGAEIAGLDGGVGDMVRVRGRGLRSWTAPAAPLDLRNSGTGVRLLAGALAAQPLDVVLDGDESLRRRPMERVAAPLRGMGASVSYLDRHGLLPMRVRGGALGAVEFESPVASAQVKSAVLLAAVGAGVEAVVSEPRRSRDHTERMLAAMGVPVREEQRGGRWVVRVGVPAGELAPLDLRVPGDVSSASFFFALAALSERLAVNAPGVGLNETRTGFLRVLERMGAEVTVARRSQAGGETLGDARVVGSGGLRAVEVGGDEVPGMIDELPALAVTAVRAEGVTRITGAAELRLKESDRLAALAANLREIGARVEEGRDGLEIEGTRRPLAGTVKSFGDHRVAMAFGVLGATPECDVRIDDPTVSDVSFPGFWRLLERTKAGAAGTARVHASARSGARHGSVPTAAGARRPADAPGAADAPNPREACLVVTIDGPAGAGKSATAKAVADELGFRHLDSGALYRAITLALLDAGRSAADVEGLTRAELARLDVAAGWDGSAMHVRLNGRRVADGAIRTARVNALVSQVSAVPAARDRLLALQRGSARGPGLVADGRDMGTVVFPAAPVKVFLVADARTRALRRLLQEGRRDPATAEIAAEAARLARRDQVDSSRRAAPLTRPADAVLLDTTAMDFQAQVAAVAKLVRRARPTP